MSNSDDHGQKWFDFAKTVKRLPVLRKPAPREAAKEKRRAATAAAQTQDKAGGKKFDLLDEIRHLTERSDPAPEKTKAPPTLAKTGKIAPLLFTRKIEKKLRSGNIRIDARLDLHGMTQEQAHDSLLRFMETQIRRNQRTLLVVTGKGKNMEGVLRGSLPEWLASSRYSRHVLAVRPSASAHGGEGAYYVILKKPLMINEDRYNRSD